MRLPEGVSSLGCAGRVRARCVMDEVGEEGGWGIGGERQ